jgi:hypothetical protein
MCVIKILFLKVKLGPHLAQRLHEIAMRMAMETAHFSLCHDIYDKTGHFPVGLSQERQINVADPDDF